MTRTRSWTSQSITSTGRTPSTTCRATANALPTCGSELGLHGPAFDAHGGLAGGFRAGGVRVGGAGDVLGRGLELHRNAPFGDHLAHVRADHVDAEHAVGDRVGQHFDEALRL